MEPFTLGAVRRNIWYDKGRGFTQDDAHLFVTEDQIANEVLGCIELVQVIFEALGMTDYRVRVGLRDPDSSKYVGASEKWDLAEDACRQAASSLGVNWSKSLERLRSTDLRSISLSRT